MLQLRDLKSDFFSPLSKEFCLYFYILMVLSFILLATSVGTVVYTIIKGKASFVDGVVSLLGPSLLYLNNRLLYTMCVN